MSMSWSRVGLPSWWRRENGKLLVADGATVGSTSGSGKAEAGVNAIENDGIGFHLPSLFLERFFHRFLVVPKKDLGGTD